MRTRRRGGRRRIAGDNFLRKSEPFQARPGSSKPCSGLHSLVHAVAKLREAQGDATKAASARAAAERLDTAGSLLYLERQPAEPTSVVASSYRAPGSQRPRQPAAPSSRR